MKKSFIIYILTTIIGLGAVSCSNRSKEEEVKEFAVGFAEKASKNQIDSLKLVYPGIENADSVALKYVAEGFVVNPSEDGGVYEIILSPDATIWVNTNEDGTYTVTESKGLFAYPQEKKDFATKTGLWDDSLNDTELAKRMNDEEFFDFMNRKIKEKTSNILIAGPFVYNTEMALHIIEGQKILNKTDQEIKGSDYDLTIHNYSNSYSVDGNIEYIESYSIEKGKTIPANGYAEFDCIWEKVEGLTAGAELVSINLKIPEEELIQRFVKFTGNEYQEYLDSKNKESK